MELGSKLRLFDIRTYVLLTQEEPALGGIRSCSLLGNVRCNAGRGQWSPPPCGTCSLWLWGSHVWTSPNLLGIGRDEAPGLTSPLGTAGTGPPKVL